MFTAQATSLTGATTAAAWLAEERTEAAVRLGWSENIHARLGQDYKRLAPLHRRPASEFVGSSDGSDWGRYLPTRTWPRKRSSQPGARGGHGAAVTSVQASCGSRWSDRGCSGGGRKRRREEEATGRRRQMETGDPRRRTGRKLCEQVYGPFGGLLSPLKLHRPWATSPLQLRMCGFGASRWSL